MCILTGSCFFIANMESQRPVVLVLSGKSKSEKEFARSLKESSSLKITDDVKFQTYLHSEMENQSEKDEFNIDTYMDPEITKEGHWSFRKR